MSWLSDETEWLVFINSVFLAWILFSQPGLQNTSNISVVLVLILLFVVTLVGTDLAIFETEIKLSEDT